MGSTRVLFCLLILTPCFLWLTPSLCAQNDVLILEPGEKATVGDPYRKAEVGARPIGDRRFVFVRYLEVQISGGSEHVTGLVSPKSVRIHATKTAPPGAYQVQTSIYVENQVYRRVGRSVKWVRTGNRTMQETFTVMVDMLEPPNIMIPVGAKVQLEMPSAVSFTKTASRSKAVADVTSYANAVTFEAKKKGTAKISVQYEIQGTERSQSWKIKVVEDSPRLESQLAIGATATITPGELPKELKATRIILAPIDRGNIPNFCDVTVVDHKIQLRAHAPGKGTAYVRVIATKGRKETWHFIPVEIEVKEAAAAGASAPAPGSPVGKP